MDLLRLTLKLLQMSLGQFLHLLLVLSLEQLLGQYLQLLLVLSFELLMGLSLELLLGLTLPTRKVETTKSAVIIIIRNRFII